MKVVIGSSSEIKVTAARQAFPELTAVGCPPFDSIVPAQPVGREETERGAEYRARKARELFPDCPPHLLWIGMENGMWLDSLTGKNVDGACIVILVPLSPQGEVKFVCWSDTLMIPSEGEPNYIKPGTLVTSSLLMLSQLIIEFFFSR